MEVQEYVGLTEQEFKFRNACRKQVRELAAFVADSTGSPAFINRVGNSSAGADPWVHFSPGGSSTERYSAPAAPGTYA